MGVCPPSFREYTNDDQKQAAAEIRGMHAKGVYPTVRRFIVDYGALRAEVRELCRR